jgi:hypothetical protein
MYRKKVACVTFHKTAETRSFMTEMVVRWVAKPLRIGKSISLLVILVELAAQGLI